MKRPIDSWAYLQNSIGSYTIFEEYRRKNIQSNWAIMTGKLLQGPFKDKYLVCIDLDNKRAIDVFLSFFPDIHTIEELSKLTIVVQHEDAKEEKAHAYFITEKPITKVSRTNIEEVKTPNLPIFEVKSDSSTIMISPSSVHPDGYPYKTIGTHEPMVLDANRSDWLEKIIAKMLEMVTNSNKKVDLKKGDGVSKISPSLRKVGKSLRIDSKNIPLISVSSRNSTLFAFTMIMLGCHYKSKNENDLRSFLHKLNQVACNVPLPEKEVDTIFDSAYSYYSKNKVSSKSANHTDNQFAQENYDIIEEASEQILNKYHFITLKESREILYYENGVYRPGGDIIIEEETEKLFEYDVKIKHISEIKGHIMRQTFESKSKFDPNLNIINLKNGLYNIEKNELLPHSPEYFSVNQKPINYDPNARPKLFHKFLTDVLFGTDVKSMIEVIAYTFYRDCPFEYYFVFHGYGSNGKSVLTSLITKLHGISNVSNVSQSALVQNRFALADLENKDVNIDNELSSNNTMDTAILKKLTGGKRQPIRIERKNQQPYDTYLYTKLFFNTNSKNEIFAIKTAADYRREIIFSFPNTFEGKNIDPELDKKLTEEHELSGIFNVLMDALRRILKHKKIYLNEKTIEQRRLKAERTAEPIKTFVEEAIEVIEDYDSGDNETDYYLTKDEIFEAYNRYCKKYKLPTKTKEIFCRELKKKITWIEGKRYSKENRNKRKMCWMGIKLISEYQLQSRLQ